MVATKIVRLLGFASSFEFSGTIAYPLDDVVRMAQRSLPAPPLNFVLTGADAGAEQSHRYDFEIPGFLNAPIEFAQASIRRFSIELGAAPDGMTALHLRAARDSGQAAVLLPLLFLVILLMSLVGAMLVWLFAKLAVLLTGIHDFPFEVPLWLGFLTAALAMAAAALAGIRAIGRDNSRRGTRALTMVRNAIEAALKTNGAFIPPHPQR